MLLLILFYQWLLVYADARKEIYSAFARGFTPRKDQLCSEWAEENIVLSSKESPEPGPFRVNRNPLLKEPLDCMSIRSTVRELVLKWPIQMGKTQIMSIGQAYRMVNKPAPQLVLTATDHLREKLVDQKFTPLYENTAIKAVLKTSNSRDSSNRRFYKEFLGGMVFFEHAANAARLKMISVRDFFGDEFSAIALALPSGDDAFAMMDGRLSAYSSTSFKCLASSPGIEGYCQITKLYDGSDQRRYHVPCPHCLKEDYLKWENFQYDSDNNAWYVCEHCACIIEEKFKTEIIRAGRWVPAFPHRARRGYTANCLYYPIGLGPRWPALAQMWKEANHG